eukprot:jgi/Ulvmu1/9205/UM005_0305.1
MILYEKHFYGVALLFQLFGSAVPRSLPFALFGGLVAYILRLFFGEYLETHWRHPAPYQAISFIVGFMVTFRSNFGYNRYWEGCTNMRLMSQRFADAVVQVITFDTGALPDNATQEELRDAAIFRDTYLHISSLLHAIAIQTLCSEGPRADLVMHDSLAQSPAADARREHLGAIFGRTHMGMASWHDVFMLRGRAPQGRARRRVGKQRMLLPLLGGISEEEEVALGDIDIEASPFKDPAEFHGFLLTNGMFAARSSSRVHTVMAWLQQAIMERRRQGGLQVPAPLLTRMYQLLSDGMLGYEQCKKLATIPFPFPHAQIVTATLVLFTLTLPLMLAAFISSPVMCGGVGALTAILYWGAHEVARELEDPFLIWSSTYNCLPFTSLQWAFNEDILASAYSVKPPAAARANGLFPSLSRRIPVRQYKPAASGGVAARSPSDSHLPGLATVSRLASATPSVGSLPSHASSASEASFSAFFDQPRAAAARHGPNGAPRAAGGAIGMRQSGDCGRSGQGLHEAVTSRGGGPAAAGSGARTGGAADAAPQAQHASSGGVPEGEEDEDREEAMF